MYPPVQTLWLGADLSALQVLSIRSFLANGHPYHLYAYEPIENVPAGVELLDASAVLPKERVFVYQRGFGRGSVSAFSNLFRYELLLRKGGWWVDADVVCLRPFDFDSEFVFATEREKEGRSTAATCVMRAPAEAPFLAWCRDECERRDPAKLIWGEIGPRLLQIAITDFGLESHAVAPEVFNPIDYWAFDVLFAPAFHMGRLDESRAVHLWNQKWVSAHYDPDYGGGAGSLYRNLRSRFLESTENTDAIADELERHARYLEHQLKLVGAEREDLYYACQKAQGISDQLEKSLRESEQALGAQHDARRQLEQDRMNLETALKRLETDLSATRARIGLLERQVDEQRSAQMAAADSLARSRGELAAVRASLSWRLTSPFRAAYDFLARSRRRFR